MKKIIGMTFVSAVAFIPVSTFAAASTIQDVLRNLNLPLQLATTLVVMLALLLFFWGLAMYVFGSSNDEKRKKGIPMMIWGIVALFVMLSIFGIINMLQATFGVGSGTLQIPTISRGR
ncbi:hypothetical protein EPO14_02315 [Patescibacteria group bacterium]|nr:MAG: hypothetical protein EPO14_02315 [Patescibacteria group bacterium]